MSLASAKSARSSSISQSSGFVLALISLSTTSCGSSTPGVSLINPAVDAGLPCSMSTATASRSASCDAAMQDGDDEAGSVDSPVNDGTGADDAPAETAPQPPAPSPAIASSYLINPEHTGSVEDSMLVPPLRQAWAHDFPGPASYPLI